MENALGLGVVFNGAIYNHHSLREELSAQGCAFSSTGDTEAILKAWHAWGPRALERFRGMFAFALGERDSGMTFLARDRLGVKPLYYTVDDARLRFASAPPALLAAGGVELHPGAGAEAAVAGRAAGGLAAGPRRVTPAAAPVLRSIHQSIQGETT